jgi:two-component system chemotaxis response regulator CheY
MAASILVVDDDESIRELLRMHLSNAGYEVNVAEDAIAAGYLVLRSPPDLIISDVSMPHMDGFEFIAALKADSTLPKIPVIFPTTTATSAARPSARWVISPSRCAPTGCSRWWRGTCRAGRYP